MYCGARYECLCPKNTEQFIPNSVFRHHNYLMNVYSNRTAEVIDDFSVAGGNIRRQVKSHACHLSLFFSSITISPVCTLQRFYLIIPETLGHTQWREVLGYWESQKKPRIIWPLTLVSLLSLHHWSSHRWASLAEGWVWYVVLSRNFYPQWQWCHEMKRAC